MDETRDTLLSRLRDRSDQAAWRTFDGLYRELLVGYARARGLSDADAQDVAQQCVTAVMESIATYRHEASFRAWLRAIAERKVIDVYRRGRREVPLGSGVIAARQDDATGIDTLWRRNWERAHLRHALEAVRREVAERTWAAFERYALEGRPPEAVATELGMSVGLVYVAKHRVLERLRAMLTDLTGHDLTGDDP